MRFAPMQPRLKAHGALLIVAIIYGVNYVIAKEVMNGFIGPRGFIVLRVVGASILFWLFHAFSKSDKTINRKDWPRILASGFFGVALNQILFFEGLHLTTPINASVIMTSNPVLVLLMSAAFLHEPIGRWRLFGVLLGGAGALYLILGKGDMSLLDSEVSLGNFLVFINAASFGAYLVIVKPLMVKYQPLQVIKWVFLAGMLFVLPAGFDQVLEIQWNTFTPTIWAQVAFVIIATTFIAYLFNIYALKTVRSTTASIYIYTQPLFATIIALWLGKDSLTASILFAAALIFAGVYLVSFSKK